MALLRDLGTDRLLLKLHTIDHAEEAHRLLYGDPEVAPHFAGKLDILEETRERFREKIWLNKHSGGQGWGYWSVIRREDHQLIGVVIFGHPDRIYWSSSWPGLYEGSPLPTALYGNRVRPGTDILGTRVCDRGRRRRPRIRV